MDPPRRYHDDHGDDGEYFHGPGAPDPPHYVHEDDEDKSVYDGSSSDDWPECLGTCNEGKCELHQPRPGHEQSCYLADEHKQGGYDYYGDCDVYLKHHAAQAQARRPAGVGGDDSSVAGIFISMGGVLSWCVGDTTAQQLHLRNT